MFTEPGPRIVHAARTRPRASRGEISNVGTSGIFIFQCDLNCSFHDPDILVSRVQGPCQSEREAQDTHNKGCEREQGPGAGAHSTAIVYHSDKTWIKITFLLFYISNSLFC